MCFSISARCGLVVSAALLILAGCSSSGSPLGASAVPQTRGVGALGSNDRARALLRLTSPSFSIVYEFDRHTNPSDGVNPSGPLISDASGALYGTTQAGGAYGCGSVFKLTPSGSVYTESILYSFNPGGPPSDPCAGTNDGFAPAWGVYMDPHGVLYGTTQYGGISNGGSGNGIVYKLTSSGSTYTETILYEFTGGSDGNLPLSGLIADAQGALYGTTDEPFNNGTVFKLTPSGSSYTFSTIATGLGCPQYGNLLLGDNGETLYGEETSCAGGPGAIFKLKPTKKGYVTTTLYAFSSAAQSAQGPIGGLVAGKKGVMFGVTYHGGTGTACGGGGCGAVFGVTTSGEEQDLYYFLGAPKGYGPPHDGSDPVAGVTVGSNGTLYGTANLGGDNSACGYPYGHGCGTVWELKKSRSGWHETVLHEFDQSDGCDPQSQLLLQAGALYGTAYGCAISGGTVFKLAP